MRFGFGLLLSLASVTSIWMGKAIADLAPIAGVPQGLQADLRRLRQERAARLPKRDFDLSESALKAYFSNGMPRDLKGIRNAMEQVDATAYLPDVEAMLTVKDAEVPSVEREEIRKIVENARKSGKLTYLEMQGAILRFAYLTERPDPSAAMPGDRGFPFALVYSESREISVKGITDRFLVGLAPVEVTQKTKNADGFRLSPRRYALHDLDHYGEALEYSLEDLSLDKLPASNRPHIQLKAAALRLDLEKVAKGMGLESRAFDLFHESSSVTPELVLQFEGLRGSRAKALMLQNTAARALLPNTPQLLPSWRVRNYLGFLKRAGQLLTDPDPEVRRVSARFIRSQRMANLRGQPAELTKALIQAVRKGDPAIRADCLSGLLAFRSRLDPGTLALLKDVLAGPDATLKEAAIESIHAAGLNRLERKELKDLTAAILKVLPGVSASAQERVLVNLANDKRVGPILRELDPRVTSVLDSVLIGLPEDPSSEFRTRARGHLQSLIAQRDSAAPNSCVRRALKSIGFARFR